jgi:GxxExxY protein
MSCRYEDESRKISRGFAQIFADKAKKFIPSEKEKNIDVYFHEQIVGKFRTDIVVDDKIIIEVKAVKAITEDHEAQVLNYLHATKIEVGLILNFDEEPTLPEKYMIMKGKNKKSVLYPRLSAA